MCEAIIRQEVEKEVCAIVGSPEHICSTDQELRAVIRLRFTDAPERGWAIRQLEQILNQSPFSSTVLPG